MTPNESIRIKLDAIRILLREIEAMMDDVPIPVQPWPEFPEEVDYPNANPYADTPDMVPVINDDHLEVGPKIIVTLLGSRYWRIIWEIADRAKVKFVILRGAHPDGCIDVEYPKISGALDRAAMDRIKEAFLDIAVPHYPPGEEWRDTSPVDLRVGSDVLTIPQPKHISVDDNFHHRFDDKEYPHFHMDVRQ